MKKKGYLGLSKITPKIGTKSEPKRLFCGIDFRFRSLQLLPFSFGEDTRDD